MGRILRGQHLDGEEQMYSSAPPAMKVKSKLAVLRKDLAREEHTFKGKYKPMKIGRISQLLAG